MGALLTRTSLSLAEAESYWVNLQIRYTGLCLVFVMGRIGEVDYRCEFGVDCGHLGGEFVETIFDEDEFARKIGGVWLAGSWVAGWGLANGDGVEVSGWESEGD